MIAGKRNVSVQVTVNSPSAASASATIISTLSSDSSYLQARDASLGTVRSVSVVSSSATTPAPGVNILAIVLPVVLGTVLIGVLAIVAVVVKKRRDRINSATEIYLHDKVPPCPGYEMLI